MNKIKVLFICHGNICRSPMAEFIFKDTLSKRGLSDSFEISSCATSREEIGNDIYPQAKKILSKYQIDYSSRYARQIISDDFTYYDYLIVMDQNNINYLSLDGYDISKVSLLLEYCGEKYDVADPWYTGNFEETFYDIKRGTDAFLAYLINREKI